MSVSNILGSDGKILSQYVSDGGGFTPTQLFLGDGNGTATDDTPVLVEIDGSTTFPTVVGGTYIIQGSYQFVSSVDDNDKRIILSVDRDGTLDPDSPVLIVKTTVGAYNGLAKPLTNVGLQFCTVFQAELEETSLLLANESESVGDTSISLSGVVLTRIA
jgi:hypothetical protein